MNGNHSDSKAWRIFNGHSALRSGSAIRRKALIFWWGHLAVWQEMAKRCLDVVVATCALLFLSPLLLCICLFIKLGDNGPVLFWQDRVGKFGKIFRFPKFRSMVLNAEQIRQQLHHSNQHGDGVTFKMKRDPIQELV